MQRPLRFVLIGIASACSGSSTSTPPDPDASSYVPPDAACADGGNLYKGAIMDSESATEVLAGATVVVRDDPSRSSITDSMGRFALCPPPLSTPTFILDITGAGPLLGGTMIEGARPFERPYLPTFTPEELEAVLDRAGTTYDANKGVVITVAFSDGVRLDGSLLPKLRYDDGAWVVAASGDVTLFPDVTPGMHSLSNAGTSRFDVDVEAGQITWVGLPPIYL